MVQTFLFWLLVSYAAISFALALAYLRYRRLSHAEIVAWGALALFVPIFGPFFVIAARPGPRRRSRRLLHRAG
ncbi:MAG: hypothetical protein N2117_12495 [Anaerolineales bacterium]|nr:hypothetical protein [Anaerolineales bacterium]MCX7756043.1 hypothetical protein [Anaerolineales bacterium]MDW8277051.1 hypothetical protein [Anaerolineales bacterium]